jgi:PPK2 family polyphosphate:nucleotide phosphotransferase
MTSTVDSLLAPCLVTDSGFRLADHDPAGTGGLASKQEARKLLKQDLTAMADLQARLYAGNQWSLLLVFQAMDAAGKDGTIRQVMSGVNPQGCQVFSFKAPSSEELDHDFLWRCARALPERGRIGIFNRSYYEEVLVVRVQAELLGRERLPDSLVTDAVWAERYDSMRDFERHLARNGTVVRKFFLNVSKEEQRRRFLSRLEEPDKHWKFNAADVAEREHWDRYMAAYQETIRATATPESPWIVVPADHKWFSRLIVARAIVETLESLDLRYPEASAEHRATLDAARAALLAEGQAD